MIIVNLFIAGIQIVTIMFVGHLSVAALSGASLGYSFVSVTGISVMIAMSSALDTLCGQAYGAKQFRLVGIHLQQAIVVQLATCILLTAIWANTGRILKAIGQNEEIAETAGVYALYLIPCVYGHAFLQSQVKFLQTQSIVFPMVLLSGLTFLFHAILCWIMLSKSNLGYQGAALSTTMSVWLSVFIYSMYINFSANCKETWPGFSTEALNGIRFHLRLAIPSTLMVCLEFWTFELMVLLSGLLPNPQLQTSVLTITLNTSTLLFMVSFGFGAAISTRISNELGAGNPQAAKLAIRIVLAIYIVVGLALTLVLILVRRAWGYAYSKDPKIVAEVATMMLILAASNFLDGIQCILSGILRGCGKQKIGAYINLAAYYLVGVPCAVMLAFKGLWTGILIAIFVQMNCLLVATIRTGWEKEAVKAKERIQKSNAGVEIISLRNTIEEHDHGIQEV
ncbi:hypothetical protein QQ045_012661 [Rhodiola kirilowii]